MNSNVNRDVNISNFVQKVGKNYFGGINKLLKAKLDFMEEVISLLQLVRITVAESEADSNLTAIYAKEAAQVRRATTAGEPKTLSEVKQHFDDGYDKIFKLFFAIRKMPELDLIEYYNRNKPDMMATRVVQEAFFTFAIRKEILSAPAVICYLMRMFCRFWPEWRMHYSYSVIVKTLSQGCRLPVK